MAITDGKAVTEAEFMAAYERYSRRLEGLAARLVGSQDAPDVVQEALAYCWEHRAQMRGEADLASLFYGKVWWCGRTWRRRQRAAPRPWSDCEGEGEALEDLLPDWRGSTEDVALARLDAALLAARLEELPAELGELARQSAAGWSYADMARAREVTVHVARRMMRRVRAELAPVRGQEG